MPLEVGLDLRHALFSAERRIAAAVRALGAMADGYPPSRSNAARPNERDEITYSEREKFQGAMV